METTTTIMTQRRKCGQCGTEVELMYGEYPPLKCWEH